MSPDRADVVGALHRLLKKCHRRFGPCIFILEKCQTAEFEKMLKMQSSFKVRGRILDRVDAPSCLSVSSPPDPLFLSLQLQSGLSTGCSEGATGCMLPARLASEGPQLWSLHFSTGTQSCPSTRPTPPLSSCGPPPLTGR